MRIGVPKEIKDQEFRVGLTPAGVQSLRERGHEVLIESGAGVGSGFLDEAYVAAGAQIVSTAQAAWDAQLVVKVKEPLPPEYRYLRSGQLLFTYLHLAASRELTVALLQSGATANRLPKVLKKHYHHQRSFPLLTPMRHDCWSLGQCSFGARLS